MRVAHYTLYGKKEVAIYGYLPLSLEISNYSIISLFLNYVKLSNQHLMPLLNVPIF